MNQQAKTAEDEHKKVSEKTTQLTSEGLAKRPEEGELLMGGILDGDDDLGINRFNTKSAPPDLFFQQRSSSQQLQGEENSYLYTKEYKDYYKESNNPRLQKPLSRQVQIDQAEFKRLQQQLDNMHFQDDSSNFQQAQPPTNISSASSSPPAVFQPVAFQKHQSISDKNLPLQQSPSFSQNVSIPQVSVSPFASTHLQEGQNSLGLQQNAQSLPQQQSQVQQQSSLQLQQQQQQQLQIQQIISQQQSIQQSQQPQFQAQLTDYSNLTNQYYPSYPQMIYHPQNPLNMNATVPFTSYLPVGLAPQNYPYNQNMMYGANFIQGDFFQAQQGYQPIQQYISPQLANQNMMPKQYMPNGRIHHNQNFRNGSNNNNNNGQNFGENGNNSYNHSNNGYNNQMISGQNGKNNYSSSSQQQHSNNGRNNNYNLQKKKIGNGNHIPPQYIPAADSNLNLQQKTLNASQSSGQFNNIFTDLIESCKDQNSSRTIQKQFENSSVEEKNKIFDRIESESLNLMKDQFGNYVIQKLFEKGTIEHKERLFNIIQGNVELLSLHTYGCRVIQKALEELKERPLMQEALIQELNFKIMECIQDQNGNHVIQKCFETLPSSKLTTIINEVICHIEDLAFHSYGCRVIQRILEFCQASEVVFMQINNNININYSTQTKKIYEKLMVNLIGLCKCQYGNYIIQYVIEKGNLFRKDEILQVVKVNFVELSLNKFASNVTEKSVTFSDDEFKHGVLQVLVQFPVNCPLESGIIRLTKNAFGNYVVQRLYEKASHETKLQMCQYLLQNQQVYEEVASNGFGKHVLTYIEKNRVDEEPSFQILGPSNGNYLVENNGHPNLNQQQQINNINNHQNLNGNANHISNNSNNLHNGYSNHHHPNFHNNINGNNHFIKKNINSNGNNNMNHTTIYQPVHNQPS